MPNIFGVLGDKAYIDAELVKKIGLQPDIVSYETETGSYETETILTPGFMKLKLPPVSVS